MRFRSNDFRQTRYHPASMIRAHPRTAVNLALLGLAALALCVLVVRSQPSPGIEVIAADPPGGMDEIRVHVRGAVASPGVVTARPGDRVEDVIARAGGALPDADLDAVNLALRVRDEDAVIVPVRGVAPVRGDAAVRGDGGSPLLDLNTAGIADLEALPGIGPARAAAIIEGRPYASSDELLERGVLSASVYKQIRLLVTAR